MTRTPFFNTRLKNGVRVIAETFDTVQSVSIGLFFRSGVLYEDPRLLGVSHFIEHMMFKGTGKRSPKDIARAFDRIGGYLNAFTAKDYCCYYARVVRDQLPIAVEVLSDMVRNSAFDPEEFERERRVILEEIKMYEDSPDEIIHELLGQTLWPSAPLGRPILGTSGTVGSIPREDVVDVYRKQYVAGNLAICAAGNIDMDEFSALLESHLGDMQTGSLAHRKTLPKPDSAATIFQKDIEQVHIAIGTPGVSFRDESRFAVTLMNAAFGGGMSSRLFQEIREKRGLAYSVFSYHTSFRDTGIFSIYAGTSPDQLPKVLDLINTEIERLAAKGLSKVELEEAKQQLKGNTLIALESTTNRMNRLATGFLYGVEPQEAEAAIRPYLAVTQDDIRNAAAMLLNRSQMAMTVISPSHDVSKVLAKGPFSSVKPRLMQFGDHSAPKSGAKK